MRLGTAELVLPRGAAAPTALERSRRSGIRGPARSLRRWPTSIEPQDKHTVFGGEVRMMMAAPRGIGLAKDRDAFRVVAKEYARLEHGEAVLRLPGV